MTNFRNSRLSTYIAQYVGQLFTDWDTQGPRKNVLQGQSCGDESLTTADSWD